MFLKNNQKGFTLIESLFVLMVTATVFAMFPLALKTFGQVNAVLMPEETYEWNIFLIQLRKEIRMSEALSVDNSNTLRLRVDGRNVEYGQYRQLLRRTVDNEGHEIVLQNIKFVHVKETGSGVFMQVQFLDRSEETASFTFSRPSGDSGGDAS
ncbi:competence type IV pilus minor pilin ComGF [Heyndrickxia acidiproducens]|uniref:competence type IV pilus minor pilin ComGF n=1 Tax=Heyndrickxia acidiproducens TaxID=1121084 RepID=UPI0003A47AD9|nr:competence type IV pilus minor pilin ComGF [Heyndrickxia acidiproducens]